MPYISELLNNQVNDSSDATVGKLEDILIQPKNGSFSPLKFLAIKTAAGEFRYVPYEAVANFSSSKISLKNLFNRIAVAQLPAEDYTYLKRDVLDQQIVDVGGTRVVRVNDLRIGDFDKKMSVLAIDSSFPGLLRRIGLEGTWFAKLFRVNLIDWRQAQLIDNKGTLQLNTMVEHLGRLHPADLANIVEEMDIKQSSKLLASLDEKAAAKVLEELDPDLQNILVKYLGPETAAKIVAQMSTDELTDLIKGFSSEEAGAFLSKVNAPKAKDVKRLIDYPDNTAGGLMTLEYISVRPEWNVGQAIEEIKKQSPGFRSIVFIYVTGEDGRFFGVVSLRRLLTCSLETTMGQVLKTFAPPAALHPEDKVRKIIRVMTKYNLYTAAVVDKNGKLVGIVTIDDIMRYLFPGA